MRLMAALLAPTAAAAGVTGTWAQLEGVDSLPPPPQQADYLLSAVRVRWPVTAAVGLVLVAGLTALTLVSNLLFQRYITAASLPGGAVFVFAVLLLVNGLLRRWAPRQALRGAELAVIFGMLYLSAPLPQAAVGETWVTLPAVPVYFPRFADLAARVIPSWLLADPEAVRGFYQGWRGPGPPPWGAWVLPLAAWAIFMGAMLFSLYCLGRLLIHRWILEERVTFPLMELPLEMLGVPGGPSLWRQRGLWVGAALPAVMILTAQLNAYFPTLPGLGQQLAWPVGESFLQPPWSALKGFTISLWPLVVGIAYLLNTEVAASIWVFHLLFWAQLVAFAAAGYPVAAPGAAARFNPLEWVHWTEFGGCIALSVAIIGAARHDLLATGAALLGRARVPPPAPPWTLAGFLIARGIILVWSLAAGAGLLPIMLFLVAHDLIVLPLARLVAAGGLYLVDNGAAPQSLFWSLTGTQMATPTGLYALNSGNALFGRADMSFLYFTVNQSHLAHRTETEGRRLALALGAACGVALVGGSALILALGYRYGADSFRAWPLSWNVSRHLDQLNDVLANPHEPDLTAWIAVLVGFSLGTFLVQMNRRYLWWSLSPFGFVVASSENIAGQIWSSVLLGWAISTIVRRFGGLELYRRLRPFFLGLILGDAVTYGVVVLVEAFVGVRGAGT
jgi:hypothetical protein